MTAHQTASADALSDVQSVVIDTNIVLDLWVYQDPATPPLLQALQAGQLKWIATAPMREELLRVLDYPHIATRRAQEGLSAQDVWTKFDDLVHLQEVAAKASYICKDADDQKFIDLAVAHQALLLSKDKQVLRLTNRLARLGVLVRRTISTEVFALLSGCAGSAIPAVGSRHVAGWPSGLPHGHPRNDKFQA
jgi:putative PIN family toxin of toxin-antitoxin system